jgi:HK97 family phage portal protein
MLSGDEQGPGYVGGYYTGGQMLTSTFPKGLSEPILPVFRSFAEAGYGGNAVVFGVILARMSLFTEATFKFRDLASKKLYGTPALEPLENPWPGATTGEMFARMEQDVSLAGNAFIVRRSVDQLERWRPDHVNIISNVVDGVRKVVGYLHSPGGMIDDSTEFVGVDDVAHWSPIPDPLAHWRGMSWLTPVLREINSDIAMTRHKQAFFENAATPNLMIKYQGRLAPGKAEEIRAQFESKHQGPEHAWGTVVIDEGADLTVVGKDFQEMDFTNVQAAGENRVAVAGGVPGIIVGLKEGLAAATYSNYQQAMRRFADLWARPQWRSACASLSKLVTVPDGSQLWYDTSDISALREGEQARAETVQTLSLAAQALITSGYEPQSVTDALTSGDLSLLKHTGAIPTALYPDGKPPVAQPKGPKVAL